MGAQLAIRDLGHVGEEGHERLDGRLQGELAEGGVKHLFGQPTEDGIQKAGIVVGRMIVGEEDIPTVLVVVSAHNGIRHLLAPLANVVILGGDDCIREVVVATEGEGCAVGASDEGLAVEW